MGHRLERLSDRFTVDKRFRCIPEPLRFHQGVAATDQFSRNMDTLDNRGGAADHYG